MSLSNSGVADGFVGTVCGNDFSKRCFAFLAATDVWQDGSADPGRISGCLEHVHALLSDHAVGGVWLCAFCGSAIEKSKPTGVASAGCVDSDTVAAGYRSQRLDSADRGNACFVVADVVDGFSRRSVFRHFSDNASAAVVVREDATSCGARSLFPVRGQQLGQYAGFVVLSAAGGTAFAAGRTGTLVDLRIHRVMRVDGCLCRGRMAEIWILDDTERP